MVNQIVDRQYIASAHARRGFSLMELLIVIIILLALGAIVTVGFLGVRENADRDLQLVQFDQIDGAMKRFKLDMQRYPTADEGIKALWDRESIEDEAEMEKWRGPYMDDAVVEDMWGNELVYRNPSEVRGEGYYDLLALGPDREEGTADDVTNHERVTTDGELNEEFDDFTPDAAGSGDVE